MRTKCAKITDYYVNDGEGGIVTTYYAKSCKSNEEFRYDDYQKTLSLLQDKSWSCPEGKYVKVQYDTYQHPTDNTYNASNMELVTDIDYFQNSCLVSNNVLHLI